MSTHIILFSIKKKKNHPTLYKICNYGIFFQGTQEQVLVRQGRRAIRISATEVLLYMRCCLTIYFLFFDIHNPFLDIHNSIIHNSIYGYPK